MQEATRPVRHIAALIAYDGTDFYGFQYQKAVPTIQGSLEAALERCMGDFCRVTGSGRTDTGVHATGQVVAAVVPWRHPLDALQRAWNHYLPPSILVRRLVEVPSSFHPRFSATSRTYRYTVYHGTAAEPEPVGRFPLLDRYALIEPRRLDVDAMNAAALLLTGEHDFATFGQPPQGEVTVRCVEEMRWLRVADNVPDVSSVGLEPLLLTVRANAFLRRMVRNLVGTLLAVGRGDWSAADVADALAARDRSRSAAPVPPNGLCLERVDYADHPRLFEP